MGGRKRTLLGNGFEGFSDWVESLFTTDYASSSYTKLVCLGESVFRIHNFTLYKDAIDSEEEYHIPELSFA